MEDLVNASTKIWLTDLDAHLGRLSGVPHFSIVNFLGPLLPLRAEKPSNGILDVPVTNYKNLSALITVKKS